MGRSDTTKERYSTTDGRVARLAGERVLSLRELNRALLERQLLLERRKLSVPRAVERLCALQAQYSLSPYIALWTRVADFRKEQLTRALEQRRVVKSSLFRGTLHITSARDYPYFAAAWLPRTRTLTPLVHLPPSGTWRFHGRPELLAMQTWLDVDLPTREEGAVHLVRSYLAAFGPATQDDLLRFAGVRVGDVRPGLERLELRRFRDEKGHVLLDLPRAPVPDGQTTAPVRFLPKWDSALLAYATPERTRILPEQFRRTVIKPNGDVAPTVLVDGFVAARWDIDRKGRLKIEPLRRLTKDERAEVNEEGERLREFFVD
jgi:DNA glycosylase AlkZ-like